MAAMDDSQAISRIARLEKMRDDKLAEIKPILEELQKLDEEFAGKPLTDEAEYKRLNLSLEEVSLRSALNLSLVRLRNLRLKSKRKEKGAKA